VLDYFGLPGHTEDENVARLQVSVAVLFTLNVSTSNVTYPDIAVNPTNEHALDGAYDCVSTKRVLDSRHVPCPGTSLKSSLVNDGGVTAREDGFDGRALAR
jgi:hypothetical protein